MIERGEAADIVTLAEELRSTHELDKIGELPVAYIASLGEDTSPLSSGSAFMVWYREGKEPTQAACKVL